ncbi:MAG: Abi family protein [Thiohalocapsa sp.]|nr:Abi family protein [Thiohalocapsa sp.]
MAYGKPWLSYEDQLEKLTDRGLLVTDRAKALEYLERIGYYRLSGYWFPFRERSGKLVLLDGQRRKPPNPKRVETVALDDFKPGATFEQAVLLYIFDKKLRLLAMDALERIEIALRVDISHSLGSLDAFAYLRAELFHESFSRRLDPKTGLTRHHSWLSKQAQLIARSKEEFVRHNKAKYGLPLAIWVSCEVWDFGAMSKLFAGMRVQEQDAIAAKYGVSDGRVFASWLRSLNYLRNLCAHHSRLWNRNIVDQPKLPSALEMPWVVPFEQDAHARARCFLLLRITRHVLQRVNPGSTCPARLREHLQSFPDLSHLGLGLTDLGAPQGWEGTW